MFVHHVDKVIGYSWLKPLKIQYVKQFSAHKTITLDKCILLELRQDFKRNIMDFWETW